LLSIPPSITTRPRKDDFSGILDNISIRIDQNQTSGLWIYECRDMNQMPSTLFV
jgi:hypothetical protein